MCNVDRRNSSNFLQITDQRHHKADQAQLVLDDSSLCGVQGSSSTRQSRAMKQMSCSGCIRDSISRTAWTFEGSSWHLRRDDLPHKSILLRSHAISLVRSFHRHERSICLFVSTVAPILPSSPRSECSRD